MSRARPTANALRDALKREKQRFDKAEAVHFTEQRHREQSALSSLRFPRTLDSGTFFTPHLQRTRSNARGSGLVNEYMVVIPREKNTVIAKSLYNPVRDRAVHLPSDLSLDVKGKVYNLEKKDFRFIGTNKEILVFERQYNQRQQDRRWAWALASTLLASVTALTAAIFAGEYIYE